VVVDGDFVSDVKQVHVVDPILEIHLRFCLFLEQVCVEFNSFANMHGQVLLFVDELFSKHGHMRVSEAVATVVEPHFEFNQFVAVELLRVLVAQEGVGGVAEQRSTVDADSRN